MASSGTINNTFRTGYAVRITWNVTGQDVARNESTVTANVQLVSLGSSYTINSSATKSGSLTVNGTTYNFTFNASLTGNQVKTIYTKTGIVVPHNSDGTKTCAFSCSAGIAVTLSSTYYSSVIATGTGTFNSIARASSISSVTSSVVVNGTNAVTVNISRASTSFLHHVLFKYGAYSHAVQNVATSTSYAIPISWINAMVETTGTATVTVTTYSGNTQIGSATSKNFQLVIPDSVKPSISSIGITEGTDGLAEKFGAFIQGKSKFNVAIIASGVYSSTVKDIKTTVEGISYHGSNITTGIVKSSGSIGFSFHVTDSRGRIYGDSRTRDVLPYDAPTISTFKCERCNADGSSNNEGTYLKAIINFAISPLNNKNDKSYVLKYKKQSDTSWTQITSGSVYTYNSSYVSSGAILNADYGYNIILEITDYFGSSSQTVNIGTAYTLIDFNASGYGVAFGKVSEKNALEVNMDIIDRTGVNVRNGIAYYEASGQADADTTKEHLILTEKNTPASGGFYYILTVFYSSRTGNRSQIAIPYNQATGVYFRTFFNGTWSAWQRS